MLRRHKNRGFTLIEMMIVISLIIILLGLAIPNYVQSLRRAKEAVLRDDLFTLRTSIDQYTYDKLRAPQSLEDLVQAGYLREIPVDPMTNSRDTWVVVNENVLESIDQTQPGITDVHSGSEATAMDGTAYSSW
jgi:general secretion pathway protein G